MKLNTQIVIIASDSITQDGLEALIGRTGKIVETVYRQDGSISGAWVELDGESYLEEQEWYIPINSFKKYADCQERK